jgi:hypothetical protein
MSRRDAIAASAPPERLAAFRIALGVFVLGYLLIRLPIFLELGGRSRVRFDPVGVFDLVGSPLGGSVNAIALGLTIVIGVCFATGWRFRSTGPLFALGLLLLTSHRSSWGQMLHFENLMVLHVIIVAFAPSADAWSLDVRRRRVEGSAAAGATADRFGFPLRLASIVVVTTYVIAGIAKLRYGGIEWMTGDTLRNHIAYSATRLEVLGGSASPLASWAVGTAWLLPPLASASVLIELGAPLALLGGKWRNGWVASAWTMHAGIFAFMLVGFPSPLFLIAFAPMFPLERVPDAARSVRERLLAPSAEPVR